MHCGWFKVAGVTLQLARDPPPVWWLELLIYFSFSTSISAGSALWCIVKISLSISKGNFLESASNCRSAIFSTILSQWFSQPCPRIRLHLPVVYSSKIAHFSNNRKREMSIVFSRLPASKFPESNASMRITDVENSDIECTWKGCNKLFSTQQAYT